MPFPTDRGWGVNPPSGIKGEGKMGNRNKNQPLKEEGTSPLLIIDSGEREIFETSSSNPLILIRGMSLLPVFYSLFPAKADYSSRKGGTQFIF